MTKAFLFLPLLLLGCASKPKPVQSASSSSPIFITNSSNVTIDRNVWLMRPMPPEEKAIHATREQWQAAQGLYTWDIETSGKGFEVVDWDYLASKILKCRYEGRPIDCHGVMHADQGKIFDDEGEVSMMDTFPPSGDAK